MGSVRCYVCHKAIVPKEGDVCPICKSKMKYGGSRGMVPGTSGSQTGTIPGQANAAPLATSAGISVSSASSDKNHIRGIVRNYQMLPSKDSSWSRWLKSFTTGVPYTREPYRISFNVLESNSINIMNPTLTNTVNVQIYGLVSSGDISDGQELDIWGYRSHNQVMYARKIRNVHNGVKTQMANAVPSILVRIFTAVFIVAIIAAAAACGGRLPGLFGGIFSSFGNMFNVLASVLLVLGLIAVYILGKKLICWFHLPLKVWNVIFIVGICFLMPEMGVVVIMLYGIFLMLKAVIR